MWRGKTRRAQRKMRTTSGRTWKLQIYKRRSLDRTHDLCLPGKVINISPPWCPVEVQWVRRSTRGTLQRHSSVQALLVKIHGRSFADSWCGGGCGGCGGNWKMQLSSGAYFWGGEGCANDFKRLFHQPEWAANICWYTTGATDTTSPINSLFAIYMHYMHKT